MFVCLLTRMGAWGAMVMLNSLQLKLLRRWTICLLIWYSMQLSELLDQKTSLPSSSIWHQQFLTLNASMEEFVNELFFSQLRRLNLLIMTWWDGLWGSILLLRGARTLLAAGDSLSHLWWFSYGEWPIQCITNHYQCGLNLVYYSGGTTVLSTNLLQGQATLYLLKALTHLVERTR